MLNNIWVDGFHVYVGDLFCLEVKINSQSRVVREIPYGYGSEYVCTFLGYESDTGRVWMFNHNLNEEFAMYHYDCKFSLLKENEDAL